MVIISSQNNLSDDEQTATVDSRASISKFALPAPAPAAINSPSSPAPLDMSAKVDEIKSYFAELNWSKDAWTRFEPKFEALIHPDLVIEAGPGQTISHNDLKSLCRDKLSPNGCGVIILDVTNNGDGTITYVKQNVLPVGGKDGQITAQRAYFADDGRIIRITSSEQLGKVFDQVKAMGK